MIPSFRFYRVPIPWRDLVKRTVKEVDDDNCFGLAAQLAFYFLLALFPALLFGVALIGHVPVDHALDDLLTSLGAVAPQQIVEIVRDQLAQITAGNQVGLLSAGIAGAVWSSSAGMVAIIDALNQAYDVSERRSWWKRRLLAIALTIALAFFVLTALTFLLIGPAWAFRIAQWTGIEPLVATLWAALRWPLMFACIALGLDLVYRFAPNRKGRWNGITPGAILATALWIAGSLAFRLYVTTFGSYAVTYGAIAGIIVTMLWFYVSSMAILIGAEVNGVIEQAAHADGSR